MIYSTHWHHGQVYWSFLQILSIKISTPTLKKPVLSSSANHTSYTTTSTQTIMSHQLQHKDSTSIQNKVNISNTDDIHSCVTPLKHNIIVHPLVWHNWSLIYLFYLLSYQKQDIYPHLVKNIFVSRLTKKTSCCSMCQIKGIK